jgi:UDPglucose--hexose-1-phosphate uridylyltransferase
MTGASGLPAPPGPESFAKRGVAGDNRASAVPITRNRGTAMSEMRQDMISKQWVILAPERAKRPDQNHKAAETRPPLPRHRADCPFCEGNEAQTPGALLTFPADGPWQVRVVPNRFAALSHEEECCHVWTGKFLRVGGYGSADVVVESPRHDLSPGLMRPEQVAQVLEAWRQRYLALMDDPRNSLITIFRNHGPRAGTSLEHPHSQIIVTPVVPPGVRNQIDQAVRSFDTYGTCLFCTMVEEERHDRARIVMETEHFTAFCPFAARSPYEVRIFPRRHACFYGAIAPEELADLAGVLRTLLGRIHRLLDNPDYNLVVRSHPLESRANRHYHWYIVILPKLATPAGFEIGTGIAINTLKPEDAAAQLREAAAAEVAG